MKLIKDVNSMQKMTQLDFNTLPLFLSKQADNEIYFNDNDDTVNGVVYICIGSEDKFIELDFEAHITKLYTAGELWKDGYGVHCIDTPSVEIDDVSNITVSYNDSSDIEISDIDYKSRIDDIDKLISDFVYGQQLVIESEPNAYTTYLI